MGNPAAIPLSGIAPPQQNPLQQYAQIMGIRAAQQEMQTRQLQQQGIQTSNDLQQLQLQSMKGLIASSKGVDWQKPDAFDTFLKNAQANGVNPMMVSQIAMTRQKYLNELAQTDTNTLKAHQEANNQAMGYMDGMKGADPQTQQSKAAQALNAGVVRDPNMQQFFQAVASGKLRPTDEQIGMAEAGLLDHTTQADLLVKEREANAAKYKIVNGALFDISGKTPVPAMPQDPQTWDALVDRVIPPGQNNDALNQRTHQLVRGFLGMGNLKGAQDALAQASKELGGIEQKTNPNVIQAEKDIAAARGGAYAAAYGNIRELPVYDNKLNKTVYLTPNEINAAKVNEPLRYTAPQYTPEQIAGQQMAKNTGQITKPLTAFYTAVQHLTLLSSLANDLNNGNVQVVNKAKQRWAQETGQPAPVNFQAAVNAMSGEVAAALKASGATDEEIRNVGRTFSRAQSPAQLQGAISTYRNILGSKAQQLQKQYEAGRQGKPAFENNHEQQASGLSVTAPNGKTYHFKDQQSLDNFKKAAGIQ